MKILETVCGVLNIIGNMICYTLLKDYKTEDNERIQSIASIYEAINNDMTEVKPLEENINAIIERDCHDDNQDCSYIIIKVEPKEAKNINAIIKSDHHAPHIFTHICSESDIQLTKGTLKVRNIAESTRLSQLPASLATNSIGNYNCSAIDDNLTTSTLYVPIAKKIRGKINKNKTCPSTSTADSKYILKRFSFAQLRKHTAAVFRRCFHKFK